MNGVYGFTKTNTAGVVLPIETSQSEMLEEMKNTAVIELSPEQLQMKKEEYVSVIKGPQSGRYGILMGTRNGKLEVE